MEAATAIGNTCKRGNDWWESWKENREYMKDWYRECMEAATAIENTCKRGNDWWEAWKVSASASIVTP